MTFPDERPVDSPERETERILESGVEQSLEPIPKQEPLFNKKAMILWALGALAVWFAVRMVIPEVKATARDAVIQSVKEAEQKSGGRVRVRTRRPRRGVITITTDEQRPGDEGKAGEPTAAGGTRPATIPTPEPPKPPPATKR